MKRLVLLLLLAGVGFGSAPAAVAAVKKDATPQVGLDAAKALTTITGIAISPLLGTGAVGAYDYFTTPKEKRDKLPWFAWPHFWVPTLLLIGAVATKDAFGAVLPPGWKKPLDVAEVIENKVSGLVAAGAVVPIIAVIFHGNAGGATTTAGAMAGSGFAAISFAPLLNVLTVPLAVAAFAVVWLVAHVINVLILISPFGAVDAALKSFRTSIMGLLVVVYYINPVWGAVLSLIIIGICALLAGWAFRLTTFGSVYVWDFFTGRRYRFTPAPNGNWMFTARRIEKTPLRTYGRLVKLDDGALTFEYRPWLCGARRTFSLPPVTIAVGRGLFYPELMAVEAETTRTLLILPPRYKSHEETISQIYGFAAVRDIGVLKGAKSIWNWIKTLCGFGAQRPTLELEKANS